MCIDELYMSKHRYIRLLLITSISILVILLFVHLTQGNQVIHKIADFVNQHQVVLLLCRLALIASFAVGLGMYIKHLAKQHNWQQHTVSKLLQIRWRITLWFVLIDVILNLVVPSIS